MSKVAVVTDSTAYIPEEICKKNNVTVVPLVIIWGNETFVDNVTMKPGEFYSRLPGSKVMPTTSQATIMDMHKAFTSLLDQGYDVMGMFLSSKLSGTLNSAEQARKDIPTGKDRIALFDTESIAMAMGFQVLQVARAAADGASLKDCVKLAETLPQTTGIYFAVETLEFLHRGGRIGGAQRLLGSALNLKPILTLKDGKVDSADRVRTMSKTLDRIVELVEEKCAGKSKVRLATLHANAPENAQLVLDKASSKLSPVEAVFTEVSPVVGTHTGPGTVGLAYMAEP